MRERETEREREGKRHRNRETERERGRERERAGEKGREKPACFLIFPCLYFVLICMVKMSRIKLLYFAI